MESRYRSVEESKSWRSEEEEEESEDGSSELIMEQNEEMREGSTGIRWYECVFCKRGFTTAQALGGHMNIHRKHRASASTNHHHNSINNPNHNISASASAFSSPISTLDPPPSNHHQVQLYHNYHQFSFPAPNAPLPPPPITSNNQRGLTFNTNLRLQNNIAHHHSSEDQGLDLELRLGYHP